MIEVPVFPTLFYETSIPEKLAVDILSYIKTREADIRIVSEASQPHPTSDYATDFSCPIDIPLFDQYVLPHVQNEVAQLGYRYELECHWVSCYTGACGSHSMHNHQSGYDGKVHMSAILYLSNVGVTDFFSTSLVASTYMHSVASQIGKIVLFPSIVPHQYRAEQYDGNSRYTVPFNGFFR